MIQHIMDKQQLQIDSSAKSSEEEQELEEHEQEDRDYIDEPPPVPERTASKVTQIMNEDGTMRQIVRARKSVFVEKMLHLNGKPFSFEGRNYLFPIYDAYDRTILLKTARQVEKCVAANYIIQTTTGPVLAIDIRVGDYVYGWDFDQEEKIPVKVVASESNGKKNVVRITTASGSCIECTENHPIWADLQGPNGFGGMWTRVLDLDPSWAVLNASTGVFDPIEKMDSIGEALTWAIQTENETIILDNIVTHNTTFLGNNLVIDSSVIPYNKSLYVSPSHTQTRQFSNEKLRPSIEQSPLIKKYLQNSGVSTQVFEKGFANGSYIFLRSAFRSADRTRGISAGQLTLDEIQDFLGSEIPVIMECTSHYENARVLMAGTPKSYDNPIETYWQESTQNEWLVPCFHHSPVYWNFLDEKNIAPTELYARREIPPGPVCKKCLKPIDVTKGRWMSLSPGKRIKGYRISQLQVHWIITTYDQWDRLLWKRDNYPFGQFYNEVLGLSFDSASKPITRDEMIECCDSKHHMIPDHPDAETAKFYRGKMLIAGVDWGEGNDGSDKSPSGKVRHASYTVLTLGAYIDQKHFKVMLVKKYTGQQIDPDFVVRDIARICSTYGVHLIGVDWGHGWGVNNHLVRILGPSKVVQFQYLPKLKNKMKWDPVGFRYHLQRNLILSELLFALKDKKIILPCWKEIEPFAKDILAVYVEYVEYRREMKYDHKPSDPDDWFHSLNYAKLAADIFHGKISRV